MDLATMRISAVHIPKQMNQEWSGHLCTPSISSNWTEIINSNLKDHMEGLCPGYAVVTLTCALVLEPFSVVSSLAHTVILPCVCTTFTAGHYVTTVFSLLTQGWTLGQILLNITSSGQICKIKERQSERGEAIAYSVFYFLALILAHLFVAENHSWSQNLMLKKL